MKKLIFIDNDRSENAQDWFNTIKYKLILDIKIPKTIVGTIELIPDFSTNPDLEKTNILFNPNHIIITASMFSDASYDSFGQLVEYLTAAGQNNLYDRIFVDTTNKLPRAIARILNDYNNKFIRKAINNNQLISIIDDDVFRLTIVKGKIKYTPADLLTLIQN